MHIGVAGPISSASVAELLPGNIAWLPIGKPGAPLLGTLIRALVANGHQVSAYTHSRDLWKDGSEPVELRGLHDFKLTIVPFRPHSFRLNRGKPGRMVDMFREERRALCSAMIDDNPDVIHAHWTYEFAMAALDSGLRHVITAHDSPLKVLKYTRNLYRLGRYFMARRVYKRAQTLTAVSPYLREQVKGYAAVPIEVIGNPIPYSALECNRKAGTKKLDPAAPRIAMVLNGWARFKNGWRGLEAFSLLRKRLPCAVLHCFGYDYGPGETADIWAKSKNIRDGIEFHGVLSHEELLAALVNMDILLHPALEESCPLTLLEAMALSVPVLGGESSGGVPWVLDHGRAGMLVDVRSPEAMCDAMIEMLHEPAYGSMQAAAAKRIAELFTPAAVIAQYEKVYGRVLGDS